MDSGNGLNQRSLITVLLLVLYNLLPIAGVIFWDWTLFTVLLLYWLESGVIGLFNMLKIGMAQGQVSENFRINGRPPGPNAKLSALFFFPFHYGVFWIVHGIFVFLTFGDFRLFRVVPSETTSALDGFDAQGIALVVAAMVINHAISFLFVFVGEKEYQEISPDRQMREPYTRVMTLHVVILVGAWLIDQSGTSMAALALLVILKMGIELYQYYRSVLARNEQATDVSPSV